MDNIQELINKVVNNNNADEVLEYFIAKNVHDYKTKSDLSKDLGKYFSGWQTMTNKPANVNYGKKTKIGLFLFKCKYTEKGIYIEAFWPKKLGNTIKIGFFTKKSVVGIPIENSYVFSLTLPVESGKTFKDISAVQTFAKGFSQIANQIDKKYLDTSE